MLKVAYFFALTLSILCSQVSYAKTVGEVKNFLSTKGICKIATSYYFDPRKKPKNDDTDDLIATVVLCAGDITQNKGSIDEVSGCALSSYAFKTNDSKILQNVDTKTGKSNYIVVKGKTCDLGGLEELLNQKLSIVTSPINSGSPLSVKTVREAFTAQTYSNGVGYLTPVFVFGPKDFEEAWRSKIKEMKMKR